MTRVAVFFLALLSAGCDRGDPVRVAPPFDDCHGSTLHTVRTAESVVIECRRAGVLDGRWVRFERDALMELGSYRAGKKHGPWASFYANGVPESVSTFEHDERTGPLLGWYRTGTRKTVCHLHKGTQQGRCTLWSEDGDVVMDAEFENGIPDDRWEK